jgi:hypothetical protein
LERLPAWTKFLILQIREVVVTLNCFGANPGQKAPTPNESEHQSGDAEFDLASTISIVTFEAGSAEFQ